MKTVILAGGMGSRLSEETRKIPKPMVKVGDIPIIHHIIKIYEAHGYDDFIICGGYKYKLIKDYFKKIRSKSKIQVINTGIKTMTGGRILQIKKYVIKDKNFLLTYGDGVSDININNIYKSHIKKGKIVTLSAVKPNQKYGVVKFFKNSSQIRKFEEKPKEHFISGGFFVVSTKVFKFLKNSQTIFEFDCLPILARIGMLNGYRYNGFWHSLDTMKDKISLNKIWKKKNAPWKKLIK